MTVIINLDIQLKNKNFPLGGAASSQPGLLIKHQHYGVVLFHRHTDIYIPFYPMPHLN